MKFHFGNVSYSLLKETQDEIGLSQYSVVGFHITSSPFTYQRQIFLPILLHPFNQVTALHKGDKQGINQQNLIGNQFHVTLRILEYSDLNNDMCKFESSQLGESRAQSADFLGRLQQTYRAVNCPINH